MKRYFRFEDWPIHLAIFILICFIVFAIYDLMSHIARGCESYFTGQYITTFQYIYDGNGNMVSKIPVQTPVYAWHCPDGAP